MSIKIPETKQGTAVVAAVRGNLDFQKFKAKLWRQQEVFYADK